MYPDSFGACCCRGNLAANRFAPNNDDISMFSFAIVFASYSARNWREAITISNFIAMVITDGTVKKENVPMDHSCLIYPPRVRFQGSPSIRGNQN